MIMKKMKIIVRVKKKLKIRKIIILKKIGLKMAQINDIYFT